MDQRDKSRLAAYFQSNYSNDEWAENLFSDAKNEPDLKFNLDKKWGEIIDSPTPKIDLKHILYKIHFNINSKEKEQQISKTRQLYNRFSRVAVVLVLPLLALSIFLMINKSYEPLQFAEIVAPKGEKAQFVLPDGSSGYLNSGSKLKYAYPFRKNRLIELSGEGFFNVVPGKNIFTVKVHNMKVEVHGTRFNICAYDDDPNTVTTLEKGSVSVIANDGGKIVEIKPGQQAVFNKSNNQIINRKVDVDLYVSWKDNMLRFQNASFADVVKKMERWYDVKIILDEKLKYTQRYTMTIKTESIREMLDLMVVTTPMEYEIKEDVVYITNYKTKMPMK